MDRTLIQVPVSKSLKASATQAAIAQGFSSVQEVMRLMLHQFSLGNLSISIEPTIQLSAKNDSRYMRMRRDFIENKNIFSADSIGSLLDDLAK